MLHRCSKAKSWLHARSLGGKKCWGNSVSTYPQPPGRLDLGIGLGSSINSAPLARGIYIEYDRLRIRTHGAEQTDSLPSATIEMAGEVMNPALAEGVFMWVVYSNHFGPGFGSSESAQLSMLGLAGSTGPLSYTANNI